MAKRSNGGSNSSTAKEIAKLRDDVAQLAVQLGAVTDTAADGALDQVRAQIQRVKGGIDDLFGEANDRGQDAADAVRDVAETLSDAVEDTLHRRPLTTLALALGAGFIAGATWRR
jgi:ElaB/YqjD/DUF883 family membrane-anchored ribosome-binding protein